MVEDTTTTQEQPKDLEKLRDEKCIPVAQGVLVDLSTDLLPENDKMDWNALVVKMLVRSLDADLNVQTEVSYVPQLVLSALTGLNATVQACDTLPIDEARFAAIGKKILAMVAEANVRMTNVKPEDTIEDFAPVKEKLNALFAEEKLTMIEVKYVMDNIFDSFKVATSIFTHSLDSSVERAEAKAFGVEAMSDVTMKQLDGFLTSEVNEVK